MKVQVVGVSHKTCSIEVRERLAFSPDDTHRALELLRTRFPDSEAVLLSTCNRMELYTAAEASGGCPSHHQLVEFVAEFHGLEPMDIFNDLFERTGEDAVRHLFTVAGSLDSMVVGEAQILSQVKQAYETATADDAAGPLTHAAFQAAIRVAKRIATETAIHQRRVSVPSVAVSDFAKQTFEHFDDKQVLVLGAGEMAEETLTYLAAEGARQITIINRSPERAEALATCYQGQTAPWEDRLQHLAAADLVVSTTGASEPIVTWSEFAEIQSKRRQRTLFILDLAIPRDFDPEIGRKGINVYLYGVDDLQRVCEQNRLAREKEWPAAEKIIEEETLRFMAELNHRSTGPTIRRLRQRADELKDEELRRLMNKLGDLDPQQAGEIERSFGRLVNKLLHPPLESLRDQAEIGEHHGLLEALKKLFKLVD